MTGTRIESSEVRVAQIDNKNTYLIIMDTTREIVIKTMAWTNSLLGGCLWVGGWLFVDSNKYNTSASKEAAHLSRWQRYWLWLDYGMLKEDVGGWGMPKEMLTSTRTRRISFIAYLLPLLYRRVSEYSHSAATQKVYTRTFWTRTGLCIKNDIILGNGNHKGGIDIDGRGTTKSILVNAMSWNNLYFCHIVWLIKI